MEKTAIGFMPFLLDFPGVFEASLIQKETITVHKRLAMLRHNANEGGVIEPLAKQSAPQTRVIADKKR